MTRLRILFWGMEGGFSPAPLARLIASGYDIAAVVVPPPPGLNPGAVGPRLIAPPRPLAGMIPLQSAPTERTILGLAWEHNIPVLEVGALRDDATVERLREFNADLICVACFPRILPPKLLNLPRYGALNLHPSLLPSYRGPEPLFWVFHDGLEHAGVTVHWMDAAADRGDIAAQRPVALADGIRYGEAQRICSEAAADLLLSTLRALPTEVPRVPQPTRPAPRAPQPTDADYIIRPTWTARRAYNFARGLAGSGGPVRLVGDDLIFAIHDAERFEPETAPRTPVEIHGERLTAAFAQGTVVFLGHRESD